MPIANCFTSPDLDPDEVVEAWSKRSAISSAEMTVNVIPVTRGGKRYAAMAWLYVPSLWSEEEITALSEGLAAALAATLGVASTAVQVVTSVVPSGFVVEGGDVLRW